MNIALTLIGIALGLWIALALHAIYRGLIEARRQVRQGWKDIAILLGRRRELVLGLLPIARQNATGRVLSGELAQAAASTTWSGKAADRCAGELALEAALERFLTAIEGPEEEHEEGATSEAGSDISELARRDDFYVLSRQLGTLRRKLELAQRYYNDSVLVHRERKRGFPERLLSIFMPFVSTPIWERPTSSGEAQAR